MRTREERRSRNTSSQSQPALLLGSADSQAWLATLRFPQLGGVGMFVVCGSLLGGLSTEQKSRRLEAHEITDFTVNLENCGVR